jgi:hypothetical protein
MSAASTRVIVVRLSDAEYAHTEAIARMRGLSLSELARESMGLTSFEPHTSDRPQPPVRLRLVNESRPPPRRPLTSKRPYYDPSAKHTK